MPRPIQETISQDGLAYYLQRARELSVDEARDVLNDELRAEPWFNVGWNVSREKYERLVHRNPPHYWNRLERECHCAVICYHLAWPDINKEMNAICRQALPEPENWAAFPYKGLWFFLIRAFELLPPFEAMGVCIGVTTLSITQSNEVPLVQFLTTMLAVTGTIVFVPRDGFHLELKHLDSRYMRDLSFYTSDPRSRDVLVWPFLTFSVVDLRFDFCELHFSRATPPGCDPRDLAPEAIAEV